MAAVVVHCEIYFVSFDCLSIEKRVPNAGAELLFSEDL